LGLLALARAPVELAEAEVAVGEETMPRTSARAFALVHTQSPPHYFGSASEYAS
jgi:hypothetical protein